MRKIVMGWGLALNDQQPARALHTPSTGTIYWSPSRVVSYGYYP